MLGAPASGKGTQGRLLAEALGVPHVSTGGFLRKSIDEGDTLEVVGKVLPLAPSQSSLPWAVETLRFCNWCDQPAQKDLNDCPTCGRRMAALPR